ncbi:SUR7-domain-containing protein [Metschnikowia bicuspidata]|uniref:SUR7-domain-containing protein n=1 Tax=Metschnikowia bicuspidata TaxID=27322 RepID=A0A4P9ZD02_9ASCO|nr:SUR7-domain-containing protein [Metschnikowia bicuspidata]
MKLIGTTFNLLLLAGTTLLLIFILLSGASNHIPFNTFYSIKADTSDIPGAYGESAWNFWGICDFTDRLNCRAGPAYPISPVDNFRTTNNVPTDFVDNRDTYYYLSRFAFAFLLLALGFTIFALLVNILGLCFALIDKLVMVLVVMALFFTSGFAAFLTAVTVLAKNAFHSAGLSAQLGVKYLAMTWAAFACILLVFFQTCSSNIAASYREHVERVHQAQAEQAYYKSAPTGATDGDLGEQSSFTRAAPMSGKDDVGSGGIRFFRIKRNNKATDDESL